MARGTEVSSERLSPSAFMRQLRPEFYSDTVDRTTYLLDAPTLGYHLETITARNQTHDFEIFCRRLCERTICPNLKPATGPEGGGDSKADTETNPIADEIGVLTYVGDANAGRERWAFAFRAKKKWAEKVRKDVAAIVATTCYHKIYCVTAQFARAKDRARVEDDLTKQYGISVTILDRTWIVEQVIDNDRDVAGSAASARTARALRWNGQAAYAEGHASDGAAGRSAGEGQARTSHSAALVLFSPGDAWRAGESHPGTGRNTRTWAQRNATCI